MTRVRRRVVLAACSTALLCACASSRPDYFYVLSSLPAGPPATRSAPTTPVTLRVQLPAWVDRNEMVLDTAAQRVTIYEHERWAAPLAELVTQTLGRDLEIRRPDWLVAGPDVARSPGTALVIVVNVINLTLRPGDQASILAQWRIVNATASGVSAEGVSGEAGFSAALAPGDYAAVAHALSEDIAALADAMCAAQGGGRSE